MLDALLLCYCCFQIDNSFSGRVGYKQLDHDIFNEGWATTIEDERFHVSRWVDRDVLGVKTDLRTCNTLKI